MRSTKSGMPRSVVAISLSSSNAGTITATRFPSSMFGLAVTNTIGKAAAARRRSRASPGGRRDWALARRVEKEGARGGTTGSPTQGHGDAFSFEHLYLRRVAIGSHASAATSPTRRPRKAATTTSLRRLRPCFLCMIAWAARRGAGRPPRPAALRLRPCRVDRGLAVRDPLLESGDLLVRERREPEHDLVGEGVRSDAGTMCSRRAHGDRNERICSRLRGANRRRSRRDALRRDRPAQSACGHAGGVCSLVDRRLRMDDRAGGRRIRLWSLQERAADDAVRLPEIYGGARLPHLRAAEGDQIADDRAGNEPGDQQPPACDNGVRIAGEVYLLFRIEVGIAERPRGRGGQRAATLLTAHSH